MKKNYINPSLTIVEMNFEAPIAASQNRVNEDGSIKINASTMNGSDGSDAAKDRGDYDEGNGWGNGLW